MDYPQKVTSASNYSRVGWGDLMRHVRTRHDRYDHLAAVYSHAGLLDVRRDEHAGDVRSK